MNELDTKIYKEVVNLLNEKHYKKETLANISKAELKPIFEKVLKKFQTLSPFLQKSQKSTWRKAAEEVIKEQNEKNEQKSKDKKDSDQNLQKLEDQKEEMIHGGNYDDLIQPEFPKEFVENVHNKKIEKLMKKLEKEREEENKLRAEYDKNIEAAIKVYIDDKNKEKKALEDLENKRKEEKRKLERNIKSNDVMKNDEFLLLLCLMRKKKEQKYENNPYMLDFSVTLDTVYQSKRKNDLDYITEHFDYDLGRYAD